MTWQALGDVAVGIVERLERERNKEAIRNCGRQVPVEEGGFGRTARWAVQEGSFKAANDDREAA
jgi:hypothetical protein